MRDISADGIGMYRSEFFLFGVSATSAVAGRGDSSELMMAVTVLVGAVIRNENVPTLTGATPLDGSVERA
jgi:hypothetical protein